MQYILRKIGFVVVFTVLALPLLSQNKEEKVVIKAIKAGNKATISSCLEDHQGVNCTFSNGKSGLYYAIRYGQDGISELLLQEGADPDHVVQGSSNLVWAIQYDRGRIARFLLEYGADVNKTDEEGNTPLILATQDRNLEMCRLLVNHGADLMHKNQDGRRAMDYTGYDAGSPLYQYLYRMEELARWQDSIPSSHDGPHIFYEEDDRIVLTYFEHSREEGQTRIREKTTILYGAETTVKGLEPDHNTYHVRPSFETKPDLIKTSGDIFAIGDVHGRYDALVNLLVNNKVIDSGLNWTFGDRQLVFLGDVFDRGGWVTETLWLIYDLQLQASRHGGNVHLLLGNHEVMAMTGDHRYLNRKYDFFTQYTGMSYGQLIERNTALGRWLRSQNIIVRINDYLFLHAGISPQFVIHDLSLSAINATVRAYLYSDYEYDKGSPEDVILGPIGPLWYRGYGNYSGKYPEVTQEFVDLYLESEGLKMMILGHNEQASISRNFNDKVISVDVAIDESGGSAQGLLITPDGIFICGADGSREKIQ